MSQVSVQLSGPFEIVYRRIYGSMGKTAAQ